MKTSEILSRAADLVERGWSQGGWWARAESGHPVPVWDEAAVSWCAEGALIKVMGRGCGSEPDGPLATVLEMIYSATLIPNLAEWNDDPARTQEDVVAMLRRAADRAQEQQKCAWTADS